MSWPSFTWLRKGKSTARASRSSVAVVGDIRESNVTVGLDELAVAEQIKLSQLPMTEKLNDLVAQIARDKGVEAAPLREILRKLGELDVSDELIPARLSRVADELLELRASLETVDDHDEHGDIPAAKARALELIDAGDFKSAFETLEKHRIALQAQREIATSREAELLVDQGRIEELQFHYLSASERYRQATVLLAHDAAETFRCLAMQATALQNQGEDFGDNGALEDAIEVWQKAKKMRALEDAPEDYRRAEANLAGAMYTLAIRETSNERLYEVAALHRKIIARDTRETSPKSWVAAAANLASTLNVLGLRENRADLLLESVRLSEEVLAGIDLAADPEKWAAVQSNIGDTLRGLAEIQPTERAFESAIQAYRRALDAVKADTIRNLKSKTLVNLGTTHIEFGRFRNSAEQLELGIAILDQALQVVPKNQNPMKWASVKLNQSSASNSLGIIKNDIRFFELAIDQATDGLTVVDRHDHPFHWANGRWGMGIALKLIAERTQDLGKAGDAVNILSDVYEILVDSDDDQLKPRISSALNEALDLKNQLADSLEFRLDNKQA